VTADRVVALVVPDRDYAGMWRIDFGDGALSDTVNLSRAKDAALHRADRAIENGRQTRSGTPPIAPSDRAVTSSLPETESLTSEPAGASGAMAIVEQSSNALLDQPAPKARRAGR
jgi:hypothetical protein